MDLFLLLHITNKIKYVFSYRFTDCGYISAPTNGGVTYSNGATTLNEIATFTCDPGYILTGDRRRMCRKNYVWSHSSPTCVIKSENLIIHHENMPMQYTAIFHSCKNDNFRLKYFDYFHIFAQNIDCGHTLEAVLTSTYNLCFGAKIGK